MERSESLLAQRGTAAEEGDLERCIAADIVFHAAIAEAKPREHDTAPLPNAPRNAKPDDMRQKYCL